MIIFSIVFGVVTGMGIAVWIMSMILEGSTNFGDSVGLDRDYIRSIKVYDPTLELDNAQEIKEYMSYQTPRRLPPEMCVPRSKDRVVKVENPVIIPVLGDEEAKKKKEVRAAKIVRSKKTSFPSSFSNTDPSDDEKKPLQ